MEQDLRFDVVVIGAGSVGLSVAYYLAETHGFTRIGIVDALNPMSLTSAQSGENYRNWWPDPLMATFTNHSIDLLERIARATGDRIQMTRRGYALVTRRARPDDLIAELYEGYGTRSEAVIRIRDRTTAGSYQPPASAAWDTAPDGVDVLLDKDLIRRTFPTYAEDAAAVLHIRRAGSISGQQLGQYMLEEARARGARLLRGRLAGIARDHGFRLDLATDGGTRRIRADQVVNAAGPFLGDVAAMLGEELPVTSVYQQKIAFEDREGIVSRTMPFTIDLDGQEIAWSEEERTVLAEDPNAARFLAPMQGGIHCRPDGADNGRWIKLGWAYNHTAGDPRGPEPIDPHFPDIVLRGASRLHPGLAAYIGRLPRNTHHYGGYYTMTEENWPLIGPMATSGAFVAGALSGFGTMAACATGALTAAWVAGAAVPAYARALTVARYRDPELMRRIAGQNKGHL
ncbi:NAD(P)/FAD-dependent oxidoreductase [Phreatobacter sp. AB_2022a]|uniref:NAD(P)/FAD-dependent oxidoreductase n=1 Tax=Phreatobacter sp. AB_2022a TaxID=3003134 RepID=UPI0022873461|nr:FAD-binding oxidoreductase [Phreatobacter sp. AB_2022a]MCZ0735044.1 FAD-binding oxidoreductase [Phreatobacter sp. AB_2022a]